MDKITNPLEVWVFFGSIGPREEAFVSRWKSTISKKNLPVNIEVIDISSLPDLANYYNIVCTPTIIAMLPDGKQLRFIGDRTDINLVIKSCGWINYSEQTSQHIKEIINQNNNLRTEATKMKEEAMRMHVHPQNKTDE